MLQFIPGTGVKGIQKGQGWVIPDFCIVLKTDTTAKSICTSRGRDLYAIRIDRLHTGLDDFDQRGPCLPTSFPDQTDSATHARDLRSLWVLLNLALTKVQN